MATKHKKTRLVGNGERLEPRVLLAADVFISEFSASNDAVLRDGDREYPDWIELHNAGDQSIDLSGWFLTDSQNELSKWTFPAGNIDAGGFITVFASGKDTEDKDGNLHTNFRLSRSGEYLGLVQPDAVTIKSEFSPAYPDQLTDISYGVRMDANSILERDVYGFFTTPTPGARNASVFDLGPRISEVEHSPAEPLVSEPLLVTAKIDKTFNDVASVEMAYRVMYSDEVRVTMTDDGQGVDETAGDGIYSAQIPAGIADEGKMIRYYVTANDNQSNAMRAPRITDTTGTDRSPEYFGTIAQDPSIDTNLSVFHWFAERTSRAKSRSGSRVSVYYQGEFYDNVFARARGGATNGASQKFNFNDDQPLYVNETLGRVAEINMNARGGDTTYVRQPMAFQTYTLAGNESSESFLVLMRDNGTSDRVGVLIEQVDEDYLERHGLDPNGALYKFVQRSNLNPVFSDIITGIEKKTRLDEGLDDINEVVKGLKLSTQEARGSTVFDLFNVAQLLNYLALRSITLDADDVRKNFYLYRDTDGTGQWSIFPWDKDWTFGITGDGGQFLEHPFFADEAHRKDNALQWNRLYDAVFNDPVLQSMYLRRLRTVMDEVLQPRGTTNGILEQLAEEIADSAKGDISGNISTITSYLRGRRDTLYNDHVVDPGDTGKIQDLVSEFTEGQFFIPTNNDLGQTWTEVADPANIAEWQTGTTGLGFGSRFSELVNTEAIPLQSCATCTSIYLRVPFDVEDADAIKRMTLQMKYDDGFIAYLNGTEIARAGVRGDISFDMDSRSHRNSEALKFQNFLVSEHTDALRDGRNVLAIQVVNSSPTSNDMLVLPKLVDGVISSTAAAGIPLAQVGNPAISFGAVDHDPAGGQDQEYIELRNENDTAVDVSGWRIEGGVEHNFPAGTVIPAGRSLYLSPNVPAFMSRSEGPTGGQRLFVQGTYNGRLSNFGETLTLIARDGTEMDSYTTPVSASDVQNFLRVAEVHYNPAGATDSTEFIELVNVSSDQALDLAGVQITDGPETPFVIPAGTTLAAGQRLVIARNREALLQANPDLAGEAVLGDFVGNLNNNGERIKVDDADGNTVVDFRYDDSTIWPQSADGAGASLVVIDVNANVDELSKDYRWRGSFEFGGSPGAEGAAPIDVVVNEVLSNTDGQDDAIEILNNSAVEVDLGGWFLSDDSDNLRKYQIAQGTSIAPGGYVVVTEALFNSDAANDAFALDGDDGDDVWLSAPSGDSIGFVDDVHFGGSRNSESFSRQPNGVGYLWPSTPSLNAANGAARSPQVVISELHYNPAEPTQGAVQILSNLDGNDLEFIELHNPSGSPVDLSQWRIRGGIEFDFDEGLRLDSNETLAVLSFNPDNPRNAERRAAFLANYGVESAVTLIGGYDGSLSNSQESIRLQAAALTEEGTTVHYFEDRVVYDDVQPWPESADGGGNALGRQDFSGIGTGPQNWIAQQPSPGSLGLVNIDINGDGQITPDDIDALCVQVMQENNPAYDLNRDAATNLDDVMFYVEQLLGTTAGDRNLDGKFNSTDLVVLFQIGEYEDGVAKNSTWAEGDWNCDSEFDSSDLVLAFQSGSYGVSATPRKSRVDAAVAAALADEPTSTNNPLKADSQHGLSLSSEQSNQLLLMNELETQAVFKDHSEARISSTNVNSIDQVFGEFASDSDEAQLTI